MELRFAVKAVLFGWILSDSLSLAIHTLRYVTAITPAISFTTGELDGEQFVHYDSNITEVIPKTEWIKISAVQPDYWKSEKERMWRELEDLQHLLNLAVELFNQTKGGHTLQWVYGCELHDDNTTRGYDRYGYDGEDFISLNLTTGTWTAAKPQAVIMTKWDPDGRYARDWENYLEKECIELLKQYMSYRREALERKGGGSGGAPIGVIVGVVAALVALVALIAVVAGIVVWKKRNSGFRLVPAKAASEGDSSSNTSV